MSIEYAITLYEMGKYNDARDQLNKLLSKDPENYFGHVYLALCLLKMKRLEEAHKEADIALNLNPSEVPSIYAKSLIYIAEEKYIKAEELLLQGLEIEPQNINILLNLSICRTCRHDFNGAYKYSSNAISIEPDNQDVVNLHISILNRLGKQKEAQGLLDGALFNSPEDDTAHANQGWAYLQNNNTNNALVHFKESLRLNPENEYARLGLLETIKSRNLIYKIFLNFIFWIGKFPTHIKLMLILVGMIFYNFAERLSYAQPELAIYIIPFTYSYFGLVILTWVAQPLFNFFLFFHPLGRYVLNENERNTSLFCSFYFIPAIIFGSIYILGGYAINFLLFKYLFFLIPIVYIILVTKNKFNKTIFSIFGILIIYTFVVSLNLIYHNQIIGIKILNYSIYAWLGFMISTNFLQENPR